MSPSEMKEPGSCGAVQTTKPASASSLAELQSLLGDRFSTDPAVLAEFRIAPLLFEPFGVSGDAAVGQDGRGAFQELDQVAMARPVTKHSMRASDAQLLGWTIAEAIRIATSGRPGPVHVALPFDVLQAADDSGSTEYILKTVREGAPGSTWAVGTEVHLVHRLAEEVAPGKTVVSLDQFGCLCSTMFRVSPNHLLWVLDSLVDGEVVNEIVVPDEQKKWAKIALDRMLSIK